MINWDEASKALKEGKKVRQAWWDEDFYIFLGDTNSVELSGAFTNYLKSSDAEEPDREVSGAFNDTFNNDWEILE
jgi:hypothetical protein